MPDGAVPHLFVRRTLIHSTDSICLHCFRTVAAEDSGHDLAESELKHTCNLADMYPFSRTRTR
jgi:hypothetical protein